MITALKRIWIFGAMLSFLLPSMAGGDASIGVMEGEVVDRALSSYGAAEMDCGKLEALATQSAAAVTARPAVYDYRLLAVLGLVKAAVHCPVPRRDGGLRLAQTHVTALKAQAATVAGAAVKPLASAAEALVRSGYGDYEGALTLSADALKVARANPLVQMARVEVLFEKGSYLVARDGDASEASRLIDKEALALLIEATRGDLPKALMALGNLTAARLQDRIGEPRLAVQYYKNYVAAVSDNARAYLEMGDVLFRSDECLGSEQAAQKAHSLIKGAASQHMVERARACIDAKGARALANAALAAPAAGASPAATEAATEAAKPAAAAAATAAAPTPTTTAEPARAPAAAEAEATSTPTQ